MDKQIKEFLYVREEKGMYGLVQKGIISHTALREHLRPFGYEPAPITTGLWRHNKNGINFTLMVDNFGIKYQRKEDALHLIYAIHKKYEITQVWTGSLYSGTTLNWEYKSGILEISMPVYVKVAPHKFHHLTPSQPQKYPHQFNYPNYGSKAPQLAHQAPEFTKIAPPEDNTVQQMVGNFLYYARTVDPKMLVALNSIAAEQANSTEATAKAVTQLLKYASKHSEAITRYYTSGMIFHTHSDASFLSDPVAKSRSGGYHYLST